MVSITQYVVVGRLPWGRTVAAVRRIRSAAQARQLEGIIERCTTLESELLAQHEQEIRYLEQRQSGVGRQEALALDQIMDGACATIDTICSGFERGGRAGILMERGRMASRLRQLCFPAGLQAVVQVSYEEQLAQMVRLKRLFAQDEVASMLDALGLREAAQAIVDTLPGYEQAIQRQRTQITFKDIQAIRRNVHLSLTGLVSTILGTFYNEHDHNHQEARDALLMALAEQEGIVRQQRRGRTARTDIDPDSGVEVPVDPVLVDP